MPSDDTYISKHPRDEINGLLTRQKILDGARQTFLLDGYAGASIDCIVAQAGVSKATLYRHFNSKDAVFEALIVAEAERIAQALPSIDTDDPDPRSAIGHIGVAILETFNHPLTYATLRLIIGAHGRFPRLGKEFHDRSLGPTVQQISSYLDARATACGFQFKDTRAAAEEFARRCLAQVIESVLIPGRPCLTEAECTAIVEDCLSSYAIRRLMSFATVRPGTG